jgi:hypothetical protein
MATTAIPNTPRFDVGNRQACILLKAIHPPTGKTFHRGYTSMRAALARGVALVRNDYCIEIRSPAFLEKRSRRSRDPAAFVVRDRRYVQA